MRYEPPNGMAEFVRVLQLASPEAAADVLRLTFENVAATALVEEIRLRRAAPLLLAACKLALAAIEQGAPLDWTQLTVAITTAEPEHAEAPHA